MALKELTIEVSLKPFLRRNAPSLGEVCRELFRPWLPAVRDAELISVLLWSGDGSEILEYSGDLRRQFDWARYVGIMNRPLPADIEQTDPHRRNAMIGHPFEPDTEKTDYRFLAGLVRELKNTGRELTGKTIRIGTAFDPGPEFSISDFKYRTHREICRGSYGTLSRELVSCHSVLHADSGSYAGFPDGIPEGTPFGQFLGRQAACFLQDMGMEFLWLSNGFGFGNFPWSYNGVVFDGTEFHPEELETVRRQMLELFWREFRKECSAPVFVRGTNLTTGRDLSCDGVPLKEIYESGAIQAPPVNSPWAPLNYDFGSELIGWMSHAAGFPADDFTFRFYVCDPWFQTKPWLANYEREPYDIYMPWAVSRLRKNGRVVIPDRINLVTVDDCRGNMPEEAAEQIVPHLRQAQRDAPDAPGPFLWLYPFEEYHRWITKESGRIGEVFAGDHFLRDAVNNGLPLNTVMNTAECDALPAGRVVFSPVPEAGTAWEAKLLEFARNGGKILLYGPLEHSERVRNLLKIRLAEPLEGVLGLEGTDLPETFAPDRTIFHASLYSGGGIRESGGSEVIAGCFRGGEHRTLAAECRFEGGGHLIWIRTSTPRCHAFSFQAEYIGKLPREPYFEPAVLTRSLLARFGWRFEYPRRSADEWYPHQTLSVHDGGFRFAGRNLTQTVEHRIGTPFGAPAMCGTDFELKRNLACGHFPQSWNRECRVFLTGDDSLIRVHERSSQLTDRERCLEVSGLKNAVLRIFPPVGRRDLVEVAVLPGDNCVTLPRIPWKRCVSDGWEYVETEPVTGNVAVYW